jgi:hypothetical protein
MSKRLVEDGRVRLNPDYFKLEQIPIEFTHNLRA